MLQNRLYSLERKKKKERERDIEREGTGQELTEMAYLRLQ